jgi:hypothetical protein
MVYARPFIVSTEYRGPIDARVPRGVLLDDNFYNQSEGSRKSPKSKVEPFSEQSDGPIIPAEELWSWQSSSFTNHTDTTDSTSDSSDDNEAEAGYRTMCKSFQLTANRQRHLETMLRRLTMEPHKIGSTMAFVIDHTQSADKVNLPNFKFIAFPTLITHVRLWI